MKRLLFILFVITGFGANAQMLDSTRNKAFDNLQLEAKWFGGFLWAHSPTVMYLQRAHTQAAELTVSKPVSGLKPWHLFYKNSVVGVSLIHYRLGYNDVLGNATGLYTFNRFNLVGNRGTHLRFGMGVGVGYLSKVFNKDDNHKNVTIGSHINALVNFQLLFEQCLTPRLFFNAGVGITHFSNGAFKTPNLGLNLPAVTAGLLYRFQPAPVVNRYQRNEFDINKQLIFSVIATIGRKQIYPPDGYSYMVNGLMFNITKQVGYKSGLTLTIEAFNDRSIRALMNYTDPNVNPKYFQTVRPGIAFGYDVWLGKLSFLFQAGVYPYTYYKGDGRIYSRLALRYSLPYGLLANFSLKSHFAKADCFEFGIGYTLFNRQRVMRLL
ncbi:MAG: acyloxyacyl hydrolase [Sphingobacteriales bacterium JAD_PAG50586_3]|nr:MAG: acyloxyacyl hydrolase [Sphingobacteriales bacterium JAD_PAG50586_3]